MTAAIPATNRLHPRIDAGTARSVTAMGPEAAIADLLRGIHEEHADAFAATNGVDPEWALWYAERLASPLGALLGTSFEPHALAETLSELDARYRADGVASAWPEFYAAQLAAGR